MRAKIVIMPSYHRALWCPSCGVANGHRYLCPESATGRRCMTEAAPAPPATSSGRRRRKPPISGAR